MPSGEAIPLHAQWVQRNGADGYQIFCLAQNGNNLFAGVQDFSLEQNHPNPFSTGTKISWQSPVSGWQTLKIYDLLGNQVATIVDEYKAAGKQELDFNPATSIRNPAPGVYYYQLKSGPFIQTRKMVMLQ